MRARERVPGWEASGGGEGVTVRTDKGNHRAARLVLCAGPWMADLVPVLDGVAVPERQVLIWTRPHDPALFAPDRFPVFNLQVEEGHFYGFPVYEVPGFKFGRHHHRGEHMPAEAMRRDVDAEDEALLRGFGGRCFPAGTGDTLALRACMFTNTPDEHFIADTHPAFPQVVLASPCSGHGYKFCSVMGEILADLATADGSTAHDISFLRLGRPGLGASLGATARGGSPF